MDLINQKKSGHSPKRAGVWVVIFGLAGLVVSLGCSVGALIVQVETPTPTPFKTPQPTFTFTPNWTSTFTPSPMPTETPSPTLTPTQTPTPSPTSAEAPAEAAEAAPPPPAEPTATPVPVEPAATPTPAFPFNVVYYQHDTGSPGETRITGWIRLDIAPGQFKTLSNFQIKALAPDGQVYLSELSGPGTADSTVAGAGDNHRMNTKLEIRPYTSGPYKIQLVEGGVQVSPEVEVNFGAEPRQYIHFDFFKQQ
ncbi:MAG: hypothetical protein L6R45_08415 [Anaerolineae bacterium]|nr:hypothetical protein [Anaerolineae bacterium]